MTERIPFSTQARDASIGLVKDYAADVELKIQTYRARPRSVMPPTAFVDSISERYEYPSSVTWRQRTISVEVIVVWGLFDSGDAVDQRDRFVDGFLDWVTDNVHAAGENTTIGITASDDIPAFVNDWEPPDKQRTFFATRLTLEGFAGG